MFNKKKRRIKQLEIENEALKSLLEFYVSIVDLQNSVTKLNQEVNKRINRGSMIPINTN